MNSYLGDKKDKRIIFKMKQKSTKKRKNIKKNKKIKQKETRRSWPGQGKNSHPPA